jgi:hypothetical protein
MSSLSDVADLKHVSRSFSCVVLGQFNPPIFQPSWFGSVDLLRPTEAESAEVEVIHPQVSVFTADWVRVEVTHDRISFRTERESHIEALRDLCVGTLTVLPHTPTGVIGVNHDTTFRFPDRDSFDAFGWTLVPPDLWEGVLDRPGVARLDEQGRRPDDREGYIRVRVQPLLDSADPYQVAVAVNDHIQVSDHPTPEGTEMIVQLLQAEWSAMTQRAETILAHVKGLAK